MSLQIPCPNVHFIPLLMGRCLAMVVVAASSCVNVYGQVQSPELRQSFPAVQSDAFFYSLDSRLQLHVTSTASDADGELDSSVSSANRSASYGGTLTAEFAGIQEWVDFRKYGTPDGLVDLDIDSNGFVPALAERWEWSVDYKDLTLWLRQDVRWSDDVPFTSKDLYFWFSEIEQNPEIPDVNPLRFGGEPVVLNVVDDHTVRYTFANPVGDLSVSNFPWNRQFFAPSHYYRQFHPKFTKNIEGYDVLREKIFSENGGYFDVDRPVVQPWKVVEWQDGRTVLAERNPYYWKVDAAGHQLPYIGRIEMTLPESNQIESIDRELLRSVKLLNTSLSATDAVTHNPALGSLLQKTEALVRSIEAETRLYYDVPLPVFEAERDFLFETSIRILESHGSSDVLSLETVARIDGLLDHFEQRGRVAGRQRATFRSGGAGGSGSEHSVIITPTKPELNVCVHLLDDESDNIRASNEHEGVCGNQRLKDGLKVKRSSPYKHPDLETYYTEELGISQVIGLRVNAWYACYYATDPGASNAEGYAQVIVTDVVARQYLQDASIPLHVQLTVGSQDRDPVCREMSAHGT